jgi:signal transduction histidine kinase/DNA-binding NarL/FixJ family response regulator/HPt (histidine-containing phosphotransfer) domain-containing protein
MILGERGLGTYSIDGVVRFCAYRRITGSKSGWSLGVVAPINEGPLKNMRNGMMIVALICISMSVLAAFFVSNILEKPYDTISEMVRVMEHQENLLHTTNRIAEILLRSDSARFDTDLRTCMKMMAQSVDGSRMRIFQNKEDEFGNLGTTVVHEWLADTESDAGLTYIHFSWQKDAPNWYKKLSAGKCINSIVRELEREEQDLLREYRVLSILLVPLVIEGRFWGFTSFDDCEKERVFTADEEGIMTSGALMVVNALERNQLENDLIRAHETAVAATEAKSSFLANMSHEMRTPLNAVIGLSELTLGAGRLDGEDEENLTKIYNSGVNLLGLINDILDLSKIESGKFELIPVEYDVPSLINDTVTLNSVRIGSKPIVFNLSIDESLPSVLKGDDLRVKQMFNNLLSNAFKYTKEGRVDWSLSCKREGCDVWLTSVISDTGIGIRGDDMKKLFSNYNQVDARSNRRIEGTGLGLAITKRMAEMMDGSIAVGSEYGKGSVFTLTIRQGFVNDVSIGAEVAAKLKSFRYSEHKRDRSAKLVRAPVPYARVLVVDDVPVNLDVARGLLKPYDMMVDCVTSGRDAVELIKKENPRYNAVFMDHMMPEMDGIEAVRIIREEIGTEYARTVPIIALTANALVGNEEMFLSKGFQAFLSKPIDIMALDTAVNRWVRDKILEKELSADGEAQNAAARDKQTRENSTIRADFFAAWDVYGVDAEYAIDTHFGGDVESYANVIASYARNTARILNQIRGFDGKTADARQFSDYAIAVHGIKSSSRSIGAESLGAKAEKLEFAAKARDGDSVDSGHDDFIKTAETIVAALAEFSRGREEADSRPLKPAPDPAALSALLEACKNFDADAVDEAMEALESFRYENGADLISWLREQILMSEFGAIEERISSFTNS